MRRQGIDSYVSFMLSLRYQLVDTEKTVEYINFVLRFKFWNKPIDVGSTSINMVHFRGECVNYIH